MAERKTGGEQNRDDDSESLSTPETAGSFSPLTAEPPIIEIGFISADDKSVTKRLALGPNGTRTWTDWTDPNNPRTWTEPGGQRC
jgi:hypothetical protein